MVEGRFVTDNLELWFRTLVVAGGKGKMEGGEGWKDLPMELLLRIVSLSDDRTVITAAGVCTAWREAVCAGLTHLSLSWKMRKISAVAYDGSRPNGTQQKFQCKNNMNNLVLSLCPKFTKLHVLALRQNKPQLEDNAVECIAMHCRELRSLDLRQSLKLRDPSLRAIAHGCPQLSKLNISGCSGFSDSALAYLSSFCRNLKSLNLCGCVRAVSDKALQAVACNCNQLQYLNLGWCEGVTDKGVISLASGCPDLRVLDLCGCVLITDESVVALAKGCPRLGSLGLYYCQNITDRAMYSLASTGSQHSRDQGAGLTNLNISQCTALTPSAVQAVCNSFPALHTCPGRHSLIISGCLSLTSVHCACAVHTHRAGDGASISHQAY